MLERRRRMSGQTCRAQQLQSGPGDHGTDIGAVSAGARVPAARTTVQHLFGAEALWSDAGDRRNMQAR
jgi:hypothetical protein